MQTDYKYHKIDPDTNGNPRLVVHHLRFVNDKESLLNGSKYNLALSRARKIGGRKYNNKKFGGGIVFQAYSPEEVENAIKEYNLIPE